MKVIISNALEDNFSSFVLVPTFKRVTELNGVDTVIIHKFDESSFDASVFITQFKNDGVENFVYISDSPEEVLKTALAGVGGYYFEDEFYLEDEDELTALMEELGSEDSKQLALVAPSLDVLNNFVNAVISGDKLATTPALLDSVNGAIRELGEITQQQSMQLVSMGESAIEILERASQIIRKITSQNKVVNDKLRTLEEGISVASQKASFSNSIMFYAPYTYRSNSKLLLIREFAPTRYLTSFILGYLHHLHYELNRRPKLIFVVQKGQGVAAKYSEYPMITQDNMGLSTLYNGEIVVTNNPKKDVMKELLSKPNDVFIVVDRLYGSVDIVSGRVTKVNALSSRSDVERYKVRAEDSIFSVTRQPKQLFEIPVIKNFPVEAEARYAMYSQVMKDKYELLDMRVGVKVGD